MTTGDDALCINLARKPNCVIRVIGPTEKPRGLMVVTEPFGTALKIPFDQPCGFVRHHAATSPAPIGDNAASGVVIPNAADPVVSCMM